jgi:polyferredoxin
MLVYLLLGLAGLRAGARARQVGFQLAGVLAAIAGGLALFGGFYYSFEPASPRAPIPTATAMVPWICLVVALVGLGIAVWLRRTRSASGATMGSIFDETG